jgi:ATP-dependent DNA ligase
MSVDFWRKAYELEFDFKGPLSDLVMPIVERATNTIIPVDKTNHFPPKDLAFAEFPEHLQPGKIITMQPTDAKHPRQQYIELDRYIGQPKRDGYRLIIWATKWFFWAQKRSMALATLPVVMTDALGSVASAAGPFILDGEFWWADAAGGEHRTAPQAVSANISLGQPEVRPKSMYTTFSALYTVGFGDLTSKGAGSRIQAAVAFATWLNDRADNFEVIPTAYTFHEKTALVKSQMDAGKEGEVWYDINAPYIGGKDNKNETLVRTKYTKELDVIVIDLTSTDKVRAFGAIEVGVWDNGDIKPIGSVGTGFTKDQMESILASHVDAVVHNKYLTIKITTRGFTESGSLWLASYAGTSTRIPEECTLNQEEEPNTDA